MDPEDEFYEFNLKFEGQSNFSIDIDETLTSDEALVNGFAEQVDDIENVKRKLFEQLKTVYKSESEEKECISFSIEFHTEELEGDYLLKMFNVDLETYNKLKSIDFIDYYQLKRFGLIDRDEGPSYIIDFNFNPEYIDELFVVNCDLNLKITSLTNES